MSRIGARRGDYCPDDLRADIDAINATVYDDVNNGVYKAGFATSQQAYDEASPRCSKRWNRSSNASSIGS